MIRPTSSGWLAELYGHVNLWTSWGINVLIKDTFACAIALQIYQCYIQLSQDWSLTTPQEMHHEWVSQIQIALQALLWEYTI